MGKIKKYYFEVLDSTNDKAKRFNAKEKDYVIYTNKQLNGRGQYDRKWVSNTGLTFSIILDEYNELYSKIVPIAILKYFEKKKIKTKIKTPNDIYLNGRKLGGILIENIFSDNKYIKTIIGIGLNINDDVKIDNSICIGIDQDRESIIDDIYFFIKEVNGFDKEKINEMYDKELI